MKKSSLILPAVLLFIQAVQANTALAAKVSQTNSFDEIVQIAKLEGYDFTSEDFEIGMNELNKEYSLEDRLSNFELEKVITRDDFDLSCSKSERVFTRSCRCK